MTSLLPMAFLPQKSENEPSHRNVAIAAFRSVPGNGESRFFCPLTRLLAAYSSLPCATSPMYMEFTKPKGWPH